MPDGLWFGDRLLWRLLWRCCARPGNSLQFGPSRLFPRSEKFQDVTEQVIVSCP